MTEILPSWRPGATRDALLAFLERAATVPVEDRVAYFDNDGTLWCERPTYVQYDFFVDVLRQRVAEDPGVAERAEFAALLGGDPAAIEALGLPRIAAALAGLFEGQTPQEFAAVVQEFMARAQHRTLGRPLRTLTYRPMLELIAELRRLDFTVGIVTGGGAEFLRAVSQDLYAVPPELVVGTQIGYRLTTDAAGSARAAAHRRPGRRGQRGGGQGVAHPVAARSAAPAGGRELRGRPGDAGVGRWRFREAWRCWSTTTTPTGSSPTAAWASPSTRRSRSPSWPSVRGGRWPAWRGTGRWCSRPRGLLPACRRTARQGQAEHSGGRAHRVRRSRSRPAADRDRPRGRTRARRAREPGEATLQVLIGRVRLTAATRPGRAVRGPWRSHRASRSGALEDARSCSPCRGQ